jgi:UDP-2,3-diacylglucosamine pyrophosphatase LpxH
MWEVEELFVLSDLHLAAERDAGLFRSDAALADCLRWILKETRDSVTVLAGDVLDFLVPYDGSPAADFTTLGDRTRAIIECHPEVFDALAELARSPWHRLVIMGGNHDPELVFPAVQETVERRTGANFVNQRVCWMVHGEGFRLRVGNAVVLVEHGNILDPWNRINHTTLQGALSLASRNLSDLSDYRPPPGTRLVLEVMNELRLSYQWIDSLKPETEAVLPLLWHFATGKQRRLIFNLANDYLSMKAFAWNKKIGNARDPERLYKGEKEAENSPQDLAFKGWFDTACEQQRLKLSAENGDRRLIEKLRKVSARDTFFEVEQPDDSTNYLRPVFKGGADIVIHGHTHSAKACVVEGGIYINTGTWGRLLRLPKGYDSDEVWHDFLRLLRANDVECFARPTLARVQHEPGREATTAELLEWQQAGPKTLAARRFTDREFGWRQEG